MAPITRVVVHRDGALVERRGTLPVVEGVVEIRELPLLLDEGSLRAEVTGGQLRDLRLTWDLEGVDRAAAPAQVEALAEARAALAVAEAERAALEDQRRAVSRIAPGGEDPEELPAPEQLAAWARLGEVLDPWVRGLDERIDALDRQLADDREQVSVLERQVGQLSTEAMWRGWAPTRIARLRVGGSEDAEAPAAVEVILSYRVPGATWTPAYSLDSDALFRNARFTMRALVVQATGEDWRGVSLALSTAPSSRRTELPELPALRLGKSQPSQPSPWRTLPADLDDLFPAGLAPKPAVQRAAVRSNAAMPSAALPPASSTDLVHAPARSKGAGLLRSMIAAAPAPSTSEVAAVEEGEPPPPPEVRPGSLDYPRMRLGGFDAPEGRRGRLYPLDAADELEELGVPAEARARVLTEAAKVRTAASAVPQRPLPPHHVLPGPVEDAHYRFDTTAVVDIPSDGRFHSAAVFTEPIALQVRYRTVPRLDCRAFRLVSATMERSAPLLPGPVEVHVDGSLALTTPWKGTPGRGVLELGLGVEEHLKVARNIRYHEEAVGLFGGGRKLHTEIEVQIASSLAREARVEILERLPVAGEDTITVELVHHEPEATEYSGERDGPLLKGGRRQMVQVPPGGERVALLHYAVVVTAKDELVGGDRRG